MCLTLLSDKENKMDEEIYTQSCANPNCDKMLKVNPDFSGLVYCKNQETHKEVK